MPKTLKIIFTKCFRQSTFRTLRFGDLSPMLLNLPSGPQSSKFFQFSKPTLFTNWPKATSQYGFHHGVLPRPLSTMTCSFNSLVIYPALVNDLWLPSQKVWNTNLIDQLFAPSTAQIMKQTPIINSQDQDLLC